MLSYIEMLLKMMLLFVLILTNSSLASAQTSIQTFQKILREQANFNDADFSLLEQGETIIKTLPTKDKREVAICSILQLQNSPKISLSVFQISLTPRNNKSLVMGGKFSNPPIPADIQALEIEKNDIDELKKCEVGNCDFKMSAAMIKRLQTEIDWTASDYQLQATRLFKQLLLDYVIDYSKRGDEALIQFENQKKIIRLDEDHRDFLNQSLFINEFASVFAGYLKNFPHHQMPDVENEFYWSKIKFGLKPVITLTHKSAFQQQDKMNQLFLVATKQIYSSRYIDSSLTLTIMLSIHVKDNIYNTYLIFTNHSRSDSLDGIFSDFKRSVVELEAKERANDFLQQARLRIEAESKKASEPTLPIEENGIFRQIWNQAKNPLIQVFMFLFLVVILIVVYRKWRFTRN